MRKSETQATAFVTENEIQMHFLKVPLRNNARTRPHQSVKRNTIRLPLKALIGVLQAFDN